MKIHRYDPRDELVPMDMDDALGLARNRPVLKPGTPDNVPYAPEQYENLIRRLEALQAHKEQNQSQRVARLLQSPTDVLSDPEQWPAHHDIVNANNLLTDAYRRWLMERAMHRGGGWQTAMHWTPDSRAPSPDDHHTIALLWLLKHATMPFPVGASCPDLSERFPAAARELMPFDDDVHAALVLTLPRDTRDVTLFFLAKREPHQVLINSEWLPMPDPWVISSAGVQTDPPRPRDFSDTRRHAQRWWKSMAGLRTAPGERNRQRDRSASQLIDALIAYKTLHGPTPPSLKEFLDYALDDRHLTSRRTTWRRLSRDWCLTWPELRQAVYGAARRKRSYIDRG